MYLECVSLAPAWAPSPAALQEDLYCAWPKTDCGATREFASTLVDWRDSGAARGLDAVVLVNNSAAAPSLAPPLQVRAGQKPRQIAINTHFMFYFLKPKLLHHSCSR